MSFKCDYCSIPQAPRTPLRLLPVAGEYRDVQYNTQVRNLETGDLVPAVTSGREIVALYKVCPKCAGVPIRVEPHLDLKAALAQVRGLQLHGEKCKKFHSECAMCLKIEQGFKAIPPQVLARGLENPQKGGGFRLATIAIENMLHRGHDADRGQIRARADFNLAFQTLKAFHGRGGRA